VTWQVADEPVSIEAIARRIEEALLLARGIENTLLNGGGADAAVSLRTLISSLENLRELVKRYRPEDDIDEYTLDELCNYRCTPLPGGGVSCT
jgi:hypothetical protein